MNATKVTCFAHRHMTIAEYGLYSHLREVSNKSNPKFTYRFDDRTLAERFADGRGSSKDAVNRLRQSLAKKGFISWHEGKKRVAGGRYAPRLGQILSHAEWAARYPGRCIHNVLEGCDSPVSNSALHQSEIGNPQSHLEAHQSQIQPSPVSNERVHQSHQRDISIHRNKSINTNPLSTGMTPTQVLKEKISSLSDSANHQGHSAAGLASATGELSPVSEARQVKEVDRAVSSIMSALGVTGHNNAEAWRKTVERLGRDGHDAQLVADTLKFYIHGYGISHVKTEGAANFALSFCWLLRDMTAKPPAEQGLAPHAPL
jgi:hypothetical protein